MYEVDYQRVAELCRAYAAEHGISLRQVDRQAGLSGNLGKILNRWTPDDGRTSAIGLSRDSARRLAAALGVEPIDLYRRKEEAS